MAMFAMCVASVAQTTFRYGNFIYKMYDGAEPYAWLSAPVGEVQADITVPSSVTMGGREYAVTGIADGAFGNLSGDVNINSLILPSTIRYFGENAFNSVNSCNVYITSMESWLRSTFKSGGNPIKGALYLNGAEVKTFHAPSGITSIPDYAFANCTGLLGVNLNGISSIGSGTFSGCSNISLVTIPASIKIIGQRSFSGCTALRSLSIAEGVEELGSGAFADCKGLTEITIPNTVRTLGGSSFSNCVNLNKVNLGDGLQEIGDYAFA